MANQAKGKVKAKVVATRKPVAPKKKAAAPASRAKKNPIDSGQIYIVSGTVTNTDSSPAAGFTVIAFDKDSGGENVLGKADKTGTDGTFSISYREADFKKSKNESGSADVFVRIYNDQQELLATSKVVCNAKPALMLNISLSAEQFVVRGKVTDANQKLLANLTIRVFDLDLRREELLDTAVSDDWGNFHFVIAGEKFSKADSLKPLRPELVVRAYDGNEALLAESPRIRPDDHEAVIDLTVPGPRFSKWEALTQELIPLLIGQGDDGQPLPPWEINDNEVPILVNETGLEHEQVRLWVLAAKAAHEIQLVSATLSVSTRLASTGASADTETQDHFWEFIAFYGWFSDGLPQEATPLLRMDSSKLLASLDHAMEQRYIPDITKLKERIREAIDAWQVREALNPASESQPASMGDAFKSMPQYEKLQLDDPKGLGSQLVVLLLKESSSPEVQWTKIRELTNDDALFNGVRRAIGLMQLTDGYLPLIAALQLNEVDESAAALADLVKHDTSHWIGLAKKLGAPELISAESNEERAFIYGTQIARKIEFMHPAPYVHHRVLTGEIPVATDQAEDVAAFLAVNPSMRFKDGSILVWMGTDKVQYGDLGEEKIKALTPELLKIERIAKILPSLEYLGPILKRGHASARDIVLKYSRDAFVDAMGDVIADKAEAERIYDNAAGAVATSDALVLTYSPRFSGIDLPVVPSIVPAAAQAPEGAMTVRSLRRHLSSSANFQTLFGSQDYCECSHGASLYGPAAYFADLLHTLARGKRLNNKTALDVLLETRPELNEIDLTGDNTETLVPYIDLALEILEAPTGLIIRRFPTGVGPVNGFDSILASGVVPQAMKSGPESFTKIGIQLSDDLDVRGPANGPWRIRDRNSGLKLRLKQSSSPTYYDVDIFPQSVATATKGYRPWSGVTSKITRDIGTARFPWKLPFDIARDEANAWLENLGASRYELMQAMASDRWNDIDSACEFLNISAAERLIFNSAPPDEHNDWVFKDWGFANASITTPNDEIVDPIAGVTGIYDAIDGKVHWKNSDPVDSRPADPPYWFELLKNVSLLRSRSRLTHRELLNVLETRFVRAGSARFEITGDECDTGQMRFDAMNAAIARRIHIFVRLWRKLGWSTVDLDRAIYAYGIGTVVSGVDVFTDAFLMFLANVVRLNAASELSVSQLLDLFGPPSGGPMLDTAMYWEHSGALPQKVLSRYEQWFDNTVLGKARQIEFQLNAAVTPPELMTISRSQMIEEGLPRPRISDHSSYIAAALAIPESELAELLPESAVCIQPQKLGSPATGRSVEVKGASLKQMEVVIGAMTPGAVFELKVQASNSENDSSFTDVAVAELQGIGANPLVINSTSPLLTTITYAGSSKYLRCSIRPTAGTNPSLWIRVRVQIKPGTVSNDLSLANLTVLCRYAVLRRFMGVPIKELRTLMTLSGINSLADLHGPENVLTLMDALGSLNTLGISVAQADELLLGPNEPNGMTLDARGESLLTALRDEYHAIHDESTVSDDKRSGLLKNVLTGLGWNERLIADVLGVEGLGNSLGDYEAVLNTMPALPGRIRLPAPLTYNITTKHLAAPRTTEPDSLRIAVDNLRHDAQISANTFDDLRAALQVIAEDAIRRASLLNTVHKWLRAKKIPTHSVVISAAPSLRADIPSEWKGRIYYDRSKAKLCLVGWMVEADKDTLKSFEVPRVANSPFANAVDALYAASATYAVPADTIPAENRLVVSGSDVTAASGDLTIEKVMLDTDGLEARCGVILGRLLPDWRQQRLRTALYAKLSQDLGVPVEVATALLALPGSIASQPQSFETLVLDEQLLRSDPATTPSRSGFSGAFDAAVRLNVLGKLALQQKMDAAQVPWLSGQWTGLDLTTLPAQRAQSVASTAWSSLSKLSTLLILRDNPALGALRLQDVLTETALTATPVAYANVSFALGCREDDLRVWASSDGLNITAPAWLRDPWQLSRLVACLDLARQLDLPAGLFASLKRAQSTSRLLSDAEAELQAVRQMALGGGMGSAWSDTVQKVLDGVRQRRRDAVVDYLVHDLGMRDANDLYGQYLIDPQMNPCMMTSRIKQAISSVQLFIQRCLMNLEPDVPPQMIDVKSQDRQGPMWEANRKVLLYPENWIEPELRDDKSPFFDDVVSSLQQGETTSDKAQIAVQTFLERLTDLSQLDVVATCSGYDDAGRLLITHVFARTLAEPHTYWHRQFIKQDVNDLKSSRGVWTAWTSVNLDIEGNHLFPFIWQGRLFLFWAIFSEEAREPTDVELQAHGQPKKHWRLKLAWSELKSGKWRSRHLFQDDLPVVPLDTNNFRSDDFYFSISIQENGATITAHKVSSAAYMPFVTLRFDGQRVAKANGSYTQLGSGVYRFDQTPKEASESPVDGSAPDKVNAHERMKNLPMWRGLDNIALSSWTNNYVIMFTLPAGNVTLPAGEVKLLYSAQTTATPFAAPDAGMYYLTFPGYQGEYIPRALPLIVSDRLHQFFVYPTLQTAPYYILNQGNWLTGFYQIRQLHFYALDWLQATRLQRTLSDFGVDALLSYDSQDRVKHPPSLYFAEYYANASVVGTRPDGDLEFSPTSATAQFNWELFFHVPFLIACNLSKNQRFDEARHWFHYIFNPTDHSGAPSPERYWQLRPFREAGQGLRIEELVRRMADPNDHSSEKLDFQTLIAMWKDQPFQPHLVARMRIRSYMYVVVMKYLDNLIAWGDQLFRRDTLESLNEATQYYILAAQILGRRPEGIPRRTRPAVKSFSEFSQPDDLSNALVEAENLIPATSGSAGTEAQGTLKSLYFCVPNNPKLLEYFDLIEDRLFKLRNCMNIDGVVRHLPLFEPAIDPSLLVRAAAAGVDVSTVLADMNAPLPFYRFNVMAQKATELCAEVKSLGAALLSAIEKGDAEAMALMRSGHELQMLQSVRLVKELQLHEAKANIDAIGVSLESAQKRFTHYIGLVSQLESMSIPTTPVATTIQSLALAAIEPLTTAAAFVQSSAATVSPIVADSMEKIKQSLARTADALTATLPPESSATDKVPMNSAEKRQLSELKSAHDLQKKAMDQRLVAQVLAKIPDFTLGAQGWTSSPVVQLTLGGTLLSSFANFSASILDSEASEHTYRASLHATLAGYQRRAADWLLQAELAAKEIEQITKQIAASNLRIAIASQELRNHDLQTENAHAVDEYMHSKYSNRELYNWMSGQLSNLHFQSYQLAYDVAKRAERCFKHELGVDTSFIKFGYWDSQKKGLLAGENLHSDIKRMEVAYLNQNSRELEITKHVSLRQLDGEALMQLRATGECEFVIPEWLYNLDFPAHYFRRIKSASVSLPCVVGPYTGVCGTLTLLSSSIRVKPVVAGGVAPDPNIQSSYMQIQSIATSTAQNDSGLFELNFRDERYLPFEGAGAVARIRFKLPSDFRAFDYDTISDLVVHVRYTARDGGEVLAGQTTTALNTRLMDAAQPELCELISLKRDFPVEWHQFRSQSNGALIINLTEQHFPYLFRSRINVGQTAQQVWLENGELKRKAGISITAAVGSGIRVITLLHADITTDDPYLLVPYSLLTE